LVLVREPDYDDTYILTPALVAELFAVTSRTVRRWTDAGMLPSFRTVGGHRRFRWADVRARSATCPLSFPAELPDFSECLLELL